MSGVDGTGPMLQKRWWLLVTLVALTLSLGTVMGAGKAQALTPGSYPFCTQAWLQPLGKGGDRCGAGHAGWGHIMQVNIRTFERAGCVNYEGWYGELYRSWACVPSNTFSYITVPKDGGSYSGTIRNNNLNYGGKFSGVAECCWNYE